MYTAFGLLIIAIALEVAATSALPRANGFRDPAWTAVVLGGYALSAWLLALVIRHMSVSAAYAIWSGLGTAIVAIVGITVLGEQASAAKIAALAMIVVGVVVLNLQGAH
ncbi:multidrug efflux SMR transporter [Nocardioides sp.]|uniref:DMT family transporter n=1 Tax=Nocardioides sp. TaxID=35761 RepID=UPI002BBA372A|nr:multidrug efflux SMR transporter [Nocardioides sp.]HSX66463.1 multidrug efflux SMR transporter [Nocardioides sp.]